MGIRTSFSPMGTFGKKLPPGYIELEYLESTGTQWIDTGIKPSQFTDLDVEFAVGNPLASGGNFFGIDDNIATNYISKAMTVYIGGDKTIPWYAYGDAEAQSLRYTPGSLYSYKIAGNTLTVATGGRTATLTKSSYVLDVTFRLFRANGAAKDTAYKNQGVRIYMCKMCNSSSIAQYLIPALDPNDRPCMFDLVTRRPFYNQGTGEFLYA